MASPRTSSLPQLTEGLLGASRAATVLADPYMKKLMEVYLSLTDKIREDIQELADEQDYQTRLHPNFDRLIAIANIDRFYRDGMDNSALLMNKKPADLIFFINMFKVHGLDALLYCETTSVLDEKIAVEKNGNIKDLLRAIKMQQEGETIHNIQRYTRTKYSPLILKHAFHLYNQHGLNFNIKIYSRYGGGWLFAKIFGEPIKVFGTATTLLLAYQATLGNVMNLGFNNVQYIIGPILWLTYVDHGPQLNGLQFSVPQTGFKVNLMCQIFNALLHGRWPAKKLSLLTQPIQNHPHLAMGFVLTIIGTTTPLRPMIEDFTHQYLGTDSASAGIVTHYEPYIFIWPAFSFLTNCIEALYEWCSPCKECELKNQAELDLMDVAAEAAADPADDFKHDVSIDIQASPEPENISSEDEAPIYTRLPSTTQRYGLFPPQDEVCTIKNTIEPERALTSSP